MIRDGRLGRVAQMARLIPAAIGGDREGELTYEILGNLKGGAQKLGQTLALVADGMPAPVRARLGALFGDAPALPWEEVSEVLRAQLGDTDALFAHIEQQPLASASLGQVYKGRLHDGREVAIKVQYPGVGKALLADLDNMNIASLPAAFAVDAAPMLRALRSSLLDELDYRLEAKYTGMMRAALRPWGQIVLPEVITEASAEKVLTTTLLDGRPLHVASDGLDQAQRATLARLLPAAILGPVFSAGLVNADAHPGNLLLMSDGRLGLVDFGAVATVPANRVASLAVAMDTLLRGGGTADTLRQMGVEPGPKERLAQEFLVLLEPLGAGTWDFARDDLMERMSAAKRKNALAMRHVRLAPELLPIIRATTGLHHSLRRLGAPLALGRRLAEIRQEARGH